jgi:predicted DNA-binding ribbon-helix-helix protein
LCKRKDDAAVTFIADPVAAIPETAETCGMGSLRKRSVQLSGHATSIALEPEFWAVLDEMAQAQGLSLAALVGRIDDARAGRPLASACRLAALKFAQGAFASGGAPGGPSGPG